MERVCKGSVAMGWLEKQGAGACMQRFCSDGIVGETWEWGVNHKVQ